MKALSPQPSALSSQLRGLVVLLVLVSLAQAQNKVLVQEADGTPKQIVFADHANDFSPAAANDLRLSTDGSKELDCQITLESISNGARQSAKTDLGENRARCYAVTAALEFAATPTAGTVIQLYWAPSSSSTAANRNPGGASGSDAAYSGYSSNIPDSLKHLVYIGSFVTTAQATTTIQVSEVGFLCPRQRYGSLVYVGAASGATTIWVSVEMNIVLTPIVEEVQ